MIWLIPVVIVMLFFLVIYVCFHKCFYSANRKQPDPYRLLRGEQYLAAKDKIHSCTQNMEQEKFEQVSITSFDGTKLYGRYYHHRDGAPIEIIFHGYRSMPLRDAAGGFKLAKKLGINVLAIDHRGHGKSHGHVITFGVKERHDCRCWAQYAADRFGTETPIILSGLSMGAATVIMATELDLPNSVCCVIADCPYSSPKEIMCKVSVDLGVSGRLSYPLLWIGARIFGSFDPSSCGAVTAVKAAKIPVLILHGEDDRLVPCDMGRQISDVSNGMAQIVTFPGAGHGLSYMVDAPGYEQACIDFMKSIPALSSYIDI